MKYIKTFENQDFLKYKIGDYVKINMPKKYNIDKDNIYVIVAITQSKKRPYFLTDIYDEKEPKMPIAIDVIPADSHEDKIKIVASKYNL